VRRFRHVAPWFRSAEQDEEPRSYRAWKWAWQRVTPSRWSSTLLDRIESTEWDLLILLDACRYDVLSVVADDAAIEPVTSPATATPRFLERAHESTVFDDTVYVSANPQTSRQSPGEVIRHEQLYDEAWSESLATVPPSPVYDRAREAVTDGERTVAHTLQPHYPHICSLGGDPAAVPNGLHPSLLEADERHVQAILSNGSVDLGRAWRSYRASVRFAWESAIEFAADIVDRGYTVTITADHGEAFGEWGFVEHPVDVPIKALTQVPWVTVVPDQAGSERTVSDTVDQRLADLGYRQ